jgi:hypothetical protein
LGFADDKSGEEEEIVKVDLTAEEWAVLFEETHYKPEQEKIKDQEVKDREMRRALFPTKEVDARDVSYIDDAKEPTERSNKRKRKSKGTQEAIPSSLSPKKELLEIIKTEAPPSLHPRISPEPKHDIALDEPQAQPVYGVPHPSDFQCTAPPENPSYFTPTTDQFTPSPQPADEVTFVPRIQQPMVSTSHSPISSNNEIPHFPVPPFPESQSIPTIPPTSQMILPQYTPQVQSIHDVSHPPGTLLLIIPDIPGTHTLVIPSKQPPLLSRSPTPAHVVPPRSPSSPPLENNQISNVVCNNEWTPQLYCQNCPEFRKEGIKTMRLPPCVGCMGEESHFDEAMVVLVFASLMDRSRVTSARCWLLALSMYFKGSNIVGEEE